MNPSPNRMSALDRAPSEPPGSNPFADAVRTTLYDHIGRSIGCDAADKLVADFGGRRLYIPAAPGPGDLISRSIGLLAALEMARVFGGDRLLIPVTSANARRRVRILAMLRGPRLRLAHRARTPMHRALRLQSSRTESRARSSDRQVMPANVRADRRAIETWTHQSPHLTPIAPNF
jgi:hypothetical protein